MKKIFTTFVAIIAFACAAMAQVPQGFNYQAVVRNSAGQLIPNRTVSVRISILRGSETGISVYNQTESVSTNANGLFTLIVGDNSSEFAGINWANGPYFLQSEVDIQGGSNYSLSTIQKILTVPYAHYAMVAQNLADDAHINELDPLFTAWAYEYDSLRNAPQNLSDFNNDQGFLTADDLELLLHGDTLYITGGSYVVLPFGRGNGGSVYWDSIINAPTTIEWDSVLNHPTNLSEFNNDLGFITSETQGLNDVIAINNNAYGQIKNVYTPTDPMDAVNKAYVDSLVAGLNARIDSINNYYQNMMDSANNRIFQLEHPTVKGALPGIFSVSATNKINFSQGNLQYRPRIKTWRFAVHQYDVAGSDNNNVYMQAYCSSWVDLFGYGTSSWDGGAGRYMPYETTTNNSEYTEAVDGNDLTEFYANADWGFYNPIINGGNQTAMWRTLTYSEWTYLLTQRPNASNLRGMATVESTPGYVLLPDTWTLPAGRTFVNTDTSYTVNVYSAADWASMEAAGAVFLPAAGSRTGSVTSNIGTIGNYWTSSHVNGTTAYSFHIGANSNIMQNVMTYSTGCSVRVVRDY